jgi:hypothetical protein
MRVYRFVVIACILLLLVSSTLFYSTPPSQIELRIPITDPYTPIMVVNGMESMCKRTSRSWIQHHVLTHPLVALRQVIMIPMSGERHWQAFDAMGNVDKAGCTNMRTLGTDDEEKAVCWSYKLEQPGCVIFSIGSNNQWTFELDVLHKTACIIHTFDCTVTNPTPPPMVQFHSICVGSDCGLTPLMKLMEQYGVPYYLKFDAEGYEFETLAAFIYDARMRLETTGVNTFPNQIAVEVHYSTPQFEVSYNGLVAFSNMLRVVGEYNLIHRRDNKYGYGGSEFLFIRKP